MMFVDNRWPLPDDFEERTGRKPQTHLNVQFLKRLSHRIDKNNHTRRYNEAIAELEREVEKAYGDPHVAPAPVVMPTDGLSEYKRRTVFIYFVQSEAGGPIKIGSAQNLQQRLRDLRSMNPWPLVLLGSFQARRIDELAVHAKFEKHRLHGEWFEDNPRLRQYIAEHCGDES